MPRAGEDPEGNDMAALGTIHILMRKLYFEYKLLLQLHYNGTDP